MREPRLVEILTTGLANTVQDGGRRGLADQGVSRGGAMDAPALSVANLLCGNPPGAAAVEVALFPFRLRFVSDVRFAVTGSSGPAFLDALPLPPWWTAAARAGQELRLDPPSAGARAYLALEGGIDAPLVLGSRGTDLKGRFGGWEGRGLRRGDRLPLGAARAGAGRTPEFGLAPLWLTPPEACSVARVLPAAEWEAFDASARDAFLDAAWLVSREADRQGMRLDGPRLTPAKPLQIFSHGIVPGTIQVPPDGRAIVQLADANTMGGYPKIATVIEADLWKLGQARTGAPLRFQAATSAQATAAWRELQAGLDAVAARARLALRI